MSATFILKKHAEPGKIQRGQKNRNRKEDWSHRNTEDIFPTG